MCVGLCFVSKKRLGAQAGKKQYAVRFCCPVRGQEGGSYDTYRTHM